MEINYFKTQTFNAITQFKKWKKRSDIEVTHTQILKIDDFRDVSRDYLKIRIKTLFTENKIKNKISNDLDSYNVNEEKTDIELVDSRQCSLPCSPKFQILETAACNTSI